MKVINFAIRSILLTSSISILQLQIFAAAQVVRENRASFTVIEAPWIVSLDSKDLEVRDQTVERDRKSGYFLMYNEKASLTISLFIEPVGKCKTSDECRDFVLATGNPAWGPVQDLNKSRMGDFSYFEFFSPSVQGQPVQMLNMYAEYVADGYWIDLHISKPLYKKTDHVLFENVVKSVRFTSKTAEPATDADKSIKAASKAAEAWLIFWDAGKHAETFKEVAALSKNIVDQKTWVSAWKTGRDPLGELKSRKIITTWLVASLEKFPDHSGAVLMYQSSFANGKEMFETIYLILEKDGTWRVLIYETNE